MALIIQDENGTVEDANSYISLAFFKSYHDARGNSYSAYSDGALEAAIVRATDYLDQRFAFIGERQNDFQTTQWPRLNGYDRDDRYVDGVPLEVKKATAEYALIAAGASLNPAPTRDAFGRKVQSRSESVGPISESFTYAQGAVFELPKYPAADQILFSRGLVQRGGRMLRG
jgi:hypothetical protein